MEEIEDNSQFELTLTLKNISEESLMVHQEYVERNLIALLYFQNKSSRLQHLHIQLIPTSTVISIKKFKIKFKKNADEIMLIVYMTIGDKWRSKEVRKIER